MAVVIVEEAPALTLSRNQIVYKILATDAFGNIYGPIAAKAELNSDNQGYPSGSTIQIAWTNADNTPGSVTFTAASSPTGNQQIQSSSTTQDITYFQSVADTIAAHPEISPFLTVEAEDNNPIFTLRFIAIDTDSNISITITPASIPGASTVSSPAVADNTPDNYKVVVELYVETSVGNFEQILTASDKPGADGLVTFDFADDIHKSIIENFVSPPIPSFDNTETFTADIIRQHYIRYREDFDGVTPSWTNAGLKKTMCGGLKKQTFVDGDFFAELNDTNSILSWYPDGKMVSLDQPEYIAWYNYTGTDTTIILEVTMIDEAGTSTVIEKFTPGVLVPAQSVLLIPCGYSQLNLSDEGINIKKYIIRVALPVGINQNITYVSQSRSYYVDKKYYTDKRFIVYLNGFCVPQTLRCIGVKDTGMRVNRQEAEKILPVNYRELESESVQYDQTYINPFVYRSGYLSKKEVDALQELLIYNNAYEVRSDGYLPLRITDNQYNLFTSRQFLHSIQFRAQPRYLEKAYSNENMAIGTAIAAAGWNTGGDFWWDDNSEPWTS